MGKTFGTILADPPWAFRSPQAVVGNGGRGSCGANRIVQVNVETHYPTLTVGELRALPIREMAERNAHLYLWTVNAFMVEAHEIARAWGFEPKTLLTWVKVRRDDATKPSMKTGYWYRSATEHIVFAVRGKQRLLQPLARPTAYMLPRLPHSVKPDFFYELIEENSPPAYLELFARRPRAGWDCWGNEVEPTVEITPPGHPD
jgi:N6-adenosine-specific RNA methylase IME4